MIAVLVGSLSNAGLKIPIRDVWIRMDHHHPSVSTRWPTYPSFVIASRILQNRLGRGTLPLEFGRAASQSHLRNGWCGPGGVTMPFFRDASATVWAMPRPGIGVSARAGG